MLGTEDLLIGLANPDLQCDEAKPHCKKCVNFGFMCHYGPASTSDGAPGQLALFHDGVSLMELETPRKPPVSMKQTTMDSINHSLRSSPTAAMLNGHVYQLRLQDLEALDRFSRRSVLTLGDDTSKWLLQAEIPRLASLVRALILPGLSTL